MSGEDQAAAHVTQMAANAADALTKVAAAEAAAIVDVAAAAHSNLAPSVLVVSMFETLQRQIEAVGKELSEGRKWMAEAADAHTRVARAVEKLDEKVGVQNGGVTKALNWIKSHDDRMESAALMAQGRKAQREADLVIIRKARAFYKEVWPLALAAVLGGLAVGGWFWSVLGGVPW